jgi:hypothetical protein
MAPPRGRLDVARLAMRRRGSAGLPLPRAASMPTDARVLLRRAKKGGGESALGWGGIDPGCRCGWWLRNAGARRRPPGSPEAAGEQAAAVVVRLASPWSRRGA